MKKSLSIISFIIACTGIIGCDEILETPQNQANTNQQTSTQVQTKPIAICIGVETGYAGKCPGTLKDASNMAALLKSYASDVILLQDSNATVKSVKSAINSAKSDNIIFYYSGHGGQAYTGDPSEDDGRDEYLCLYDGPMYDNVIWDLMHKFKKVHLIFDCCHSQTMFRTSFMTTITKSARDSSFNMLCWSGCPDDTYSYGSDAGGYLTNTLLKHFNADKTYYEVWNLVQSDSSLKRYEVVQQTVIGDSSVWDVKIFK